MSNSTKRYISEDWLAFWLDLFVFVVSLGLFIKIDFPGRDIKTNVSSNISESTSIVSQNYDSIPNIPSTIFTYSYLLFEVGISVISVGSYFNKRKYFNFSNEWVAL